MGTKPPKYSYVLAILFGIIAFFIPTEERVPIFFTLFYLLGGVLFSFLWPQTSWRWGLWIAGPLLVFLGMSVLFAGQFQIFIRKDLPLLLLAIASACLGGFISERIKSKPGVSR